VKILEDEISFDQFGDVDLLLEAEIHNVSGEEIDYLGIVVNYYDEDG